MIPTLHSFMALTPTDLRVELKDEKSLDKEASQAMQAVRCHLERVASEIRKLTGVQFARAKA
eukprot:15466966-Alexandrium_andersonii.AAC.1